MYICYQLIKLRIRDHTITFCYLRTLLIYFGATFCGDLKINWQQFYNLSKSQHSIVKANCGDKFEVKPIQRKSK